MCDQKVALGVINKEPRKNYGNHYTKLGPGERLRVWRACVTVDMTNIGVKLSLGGGRVFSSFDLSHSFTLTVDFTK